MTLDTIKTLPRLGDFIMFALTQPEIKESLKNALQVFAPTMYADIESAALNPGCTCIERVKSYIYLNADDAAVFLYNYITQNNYEDLFTSLIETHRQSSSKNYLRGKILKTNINKWNEFFTTIDQTSVFTYFTVTKEGDDLYVFFL
jgi:hypothetical protein